MKKNTALLLAFLPYVSWAQDTSKLDFATPKALEPIEIKSIRAGSQSPFANTLIASKQLQQQNLGQDLPFLLQQTPSAVVTSDAGAGIGYTGLRIRGTDGTRINVTLNGVPVNDPESQGTFFVNFGDLASSVSSIQIQRGVGTSTNGSGSFGATMSISNLQLSDEANSSINTSIGSFNTQKYTVQAGTGWLKGGWQFDVRLSKINSDGFVNRSSSDLKSLQLNAGWKLNEKTSFRWLVMTGKERTGQAWNGVPEEKLSGDATRLLNHYYNNLGVLYFTAQDSINLFQSDPRKYNSFTYSGQTDNYQQDYYQFFTDHKFSNFWSANWANFMTRGKGYYEEFKVGEQYSKYGLAPFVSSSNDTSFQTDLIRQLWLDNYYYGSMLTLLYQKNAHQLTIGTGINRYDAKHYGFVKWATAGIPNDYKWYQLSAQKTDKSFFAKYELKQNKFTWLVDAQIRQVDYQINGFRKNPILNPKVDYLFFNPKLGLNWLLVEQNQTTQRFYASIAIANKEPNRDDFEAANGALPRPEQLNDFELGYIVQHKWLNITANAYFMNYKDQLILTGKVNDVGAYTRTNVAHSYRAGLEVMVDCRVNKWLTLDANTTFAQNKILNFVEYQDDYDAGGQKAIDHGTTDLAFSPNFIAMGSLKCKPFYLHEKGKEFEISIQGRHIGKQYLDNTSNENRVLKSYSLMDVRFQYLIKSTRFKELGLNLMINNVLNKKYESNGYTYSYIYGGSTTTQNFYFPQAGANWLLGFSMKF